jgi:hypothetical protein
MAIDELATSIVDTRTEVNCGVNRLDDKLANLDSKIDKKLKKIK